VARGHEVELAVLDTAAQVGKLRYLTLARRTRAASRPDVVYAHFLLVPSGLIAALAGRAPLRRHRAREGCPANIGAIPGVAPATRLVVRRAAAVICVSDYLRRELETKLPEAARQGRGRLERRRPRALRGHRRTGRAAQLPLRRRARRSGRTSCASPTPSRASARNAHLRRRAGPFGRSWRDVSASGCSGAFRTTRSRACSRRAASSPSRASWSRSAMRCSRRWPAAARSWRRGSAGRPSSSRPATGELRRPARRRRLARGLERAAALPCPNDAAREATADHDVRRQAERIEAILSRAAARDRRS